MWLALGLAGGPMAALGLARFAYGLLLPPMRTDLRWSFAQAGALNTMNAAGYLVGALVATALMRRIGVRRCFIASIVIVIAGLAASGSTSVFAGQLLLRTVTGIAGAVTFIAGAALVAALSTAPLDSRSIDGAERAEPDRSAVLLNCYTAGAGVGIVASGVLVGPLLARAGPSGWRVAWLALAVLAGASLIPAALAVRQVTEPRTSRSAPAKDIAAGPTRSWRQRPLLLPGIGYALFGAGYIAYVTFVVSDLKADGFSANQITVFWTLFGLTVLAGVPLWGRVLGRVPTSLALSAMVAILVVATSLPLVAHGWLIGLTSAVLFGSSFQAVPAATTLIARQRLPPAMRGSGIAKLTVAFALGQCVGPILAGLLADHADRIGFGLFIAALTLAASAVVYLLGRPGDVAVSAD